MIKLKIDYDFHINYNSHNNDTVMDYLSFLYGSIIEKNSSNDIYALYKNTKYVFKLDDELNVKEKIFVSDKAWLNIIYCDNEHILFRYEDDDNYYFETLTHKVLSIPISSNYSDYMIKNNELFVYNELKIDTQKARFYSLNLEYLGEIRLDNQMIHIDDNEKMILDEKLSRIFKEDKRDLIYKKDDKYFVSTNRLIDNKVLSSLWVFDNSFNVLSHANIDAQDFLLSSIYETNNMIYLLYSNASSTSYLIRKYDLNIQLQCEEIIKSYRGDFRMINNHLCLIIDDPKRYTKEQRQFRNQELIGNSSILVLE